MTHKNLRSLGLGIVALGVAGCGTLNYAADLSTNEIFYADVPFRTKAPGDREVFVTPVRDLRDQVVLPTHDNGFPISYGNDEFWERPVTEMLAEVLDRQLASSRLFPAVTRAPAAETLIMKPSLIAFTTGSQEAMSGSRTFAEVGLRIEVLGPTGKDGKRPVWHDHVYGNRQVSELGIKPVSPYRLIGRALQLTMSGALSGLDGSNVARSHVPVELMLPTDEFAVPAVPAVPAAEASSERR